MANRFLNNITINDEYTLPSADGTADQIITTDGAGQLSFVDQSTINAGNAEHVVIYAKNTSGASISKGTPVYITGTVGATDTVEIAEADASDSAKMPAVGLLDDTLANNAFGYVITGGFMDNITTDPIDGSTPSSNDTVYVKSGGGLTLTKPTGSNLIQNVAKVGKVSGGNSGSLIVSSILRTNDVPNLTTGKIWVGTANNTAESDVVYLDETNDRMGIGTTSPGAKLDVVSGDIRLGTNATYFRVRDTASAQPRVLGMNASNTTYVGPIDAYAGGGIVYGASSNVAYHGFYGGGSEKVRITSAGNVGIGTTSPTSLLTLESNSSSPYPRIDIKSTSTYPGSEIRFLSSAGSEVSTIESYSNPGVQYLKLQYNLSSTGGKCELQDNAAILGAGTSAVQSYAQVGVTDFRVITNYGTRMYINTLGNVGIGTTAPSQKLDVVGSAQITGDMYLGRYIFHDNDTNTWIGFPSNDTITLRTAGSDRVRVASTGYVGINETSANARLQVKESSITTFTGTGSSAQLRLRGGYTTNEYIILGFSQDSNKDIGRMAVKRGGSGSSFHWGVSTNYGNGITNEAMILNHQGRLGINNLSPSYLLDVGGDGRVNGTFTCVTLVQTSQRDQKKDIADIDKTKATRIPFKEYKYKSSIDGSERKRYGVVAEDIENDYPELVHTGADGVKGINYIDLLVKRVAELEKELEDISLTPGPKGDKGDTGAQGPAGANGTNGKDGVNGNDHLKNVQSITFSEKTGQLEITIEGYKEPFRFNPAK